MTAIVIAAGGTAGHVYPAIALAEELRSSPGVSRIVFIGASGAETAIVPRYGFELVTLPSRPFARRSVAGKARSVAALVRATLHARRILRSVGARAVIGFGGYAAIAPVIAGRLAGSWTAIHEANAEMGRGNALASLWARHIYVAHADALRDRRRTTVAGMPVRADIVAVAGQRKDHDPTVLVMSGTERSPFFEDRVPPLLNRVRRELPRLRVVHQTGTPSNEEVRRRYGGDVNVSVGIFFDPIAPLYAETSVAIVRPGASSIAELATCGVPTIAVPEPTVARGHQEANARLFAREGGVQCVLQNEWREEEMAADLVRLLTSPDAWAAASAQITRLGARDAARVMAADVLARIGAAAAG